MGQRGLSSEPGGLPCCVPRPLLTQVDARLVPSCSHFRGWTVTVAYFKI